MLTFEGSQFLGVENIMEKLQVRTATVLLLLDPDLKYVIEPCI